MAYKFSTDDSISHEVTTLKKLIKDSFNKCGQIPWPSLPEYLQNIDGVIPDQLDRFQRSILSDREDDAM